MKLGIVLFWFVMLAGWIMNIIQVGSGLPSTIGEMTPMLIFKIVGIFVAPLGSILGWIGVF